MGMNKSILVFAIALVSVFLLSIYFIFGLNGRPTETSPVKLETKEEVVKIPEDLKIEDTEEGTGEAVKEGDMVVIHYTGYLEDPPGSGQAGAKFDSSLDSGQPFETPIGAGNVIKGWDLGVVGMKVGGKRRLIIPSELGYGEQGSGESIPPNSNLIFDLELLEIK